MLKIVYMDNASDHPNWAFVNDLSVEIPDTLLLFSNLSGKGMLKYIRIIIDPVIY